MGALPNVMGAPEPESQPDVDTLLDQLLRGEIVDLDALADSHPDLDESSLAQVRAVAGALGLSGGHTDDESLEESDDPEPGLPAERLGPYRLLRLLGAGGMGAVYLADDTQLGRRAAVKVLRREIAALPEVGLRFEREAHAIARLKHPHIVTVYGVGNDEGMRYIAMEYVEGPELDEILAEPADRRPPVTRFVSWCRDVARALASAHDEGLIHRDVKPSNIRVTHKGRAVLLDFGLAQHEADNTLTMSGTFRGTPSFASPEQVAGRRIPIDHRTDVYSLGATLYMALTGVVPFPGETREQVFNQILLKDPAAPRSLNPAIPRDLETVILTAMEKDKDRRYATAAAFADDLDAILQMRPIRARPPGALRRVGKWIRRHRATATALILAALLIPTLIVAHFAKQQAAFDDHVAAARAAADRQQFVEAIAAVDRALGVMPDDRDARQLRTTFARRDREVRAAALVTDASKQLQEARNIQSRLTDVDKELPRLRTFQTERHLEAEELDRLLELEAESKDLQDRLAPAVRTAMALLEEATSLDPNNEEARTELLDLHLSELARARAASDQWAIRRHEGRARELDREGRHHDLINDQGDVVAMSEPPGAELHLFRYVDLGENNGTRAPRLVPVPHGTGDYPVRPGSRVARVAARSGEFRVNDLVLTVAGEPINGLYAIGEPGHESLEPLDRLVAVDGRPDPSLVELMRMLPPKDADAPTHRFTFRRGEKTIHVDARSFFEMGTKVLHGQDAAMYHALPVTWYDGRAVRTGTLPKGTRLRPTAAPLVIGAFSKFAELGGPYRSSIPAGSYIALIRKDGYEDQRHPFVVRPGESTTIKATLHPEGTTPFGFAYVPASTVMLGDPRGELTMTPGQYEVGGFWMAERETSVASYLQFLNDPETQAEIKASPRAIRFPRTGSRSYFGKNRDGTFVQPNHPHFLPANPAVGMSYGDAVAYCAWLSKNYKSRRKLDITFDLATDLEWEKAARGADQRRFTWGEHFVQRWTKTRYTRPGLPTPEPGIRCMEDESPYGIYDLTGCASEFTELNESEERRTCKIRGGQWNLSQPHAFWLPSRRALDVVQTGIGTGIRTVFRKAPVKVK